MGISGINILSHLDSATSLAPVLVKDSANVTGRTIMANNAGGEHEAREKFIEEVGTGALWLGGIPLSRKIFDKTVFEKAGLNPEISIKKLPEIIEIDKVEEVKNIKSQQFSIAKLEDLSKNAKVKGTALVKKYLKLNKIKFLVTTFIPFALLLGLPIVNQQLSKKIILGRAAKEKENATCEPPVKTREREKPERIIAMPLSFQKSTASEKFRIKSPALQKLQENFLKNTLPSAKLPGKTKPAFGSIGSAVLNAATYAQVNPVGNLIMLDLGISGSRVTFVPRCNRERTEYGIKESGIIFFTFFAQKYMKKGFDYLANKVLKKPIDLDFKILGSDAFKNGMNQALESKTVPETLTQIVKNPATVVDLEKEAFEFIQKNHANPKFVTLHAAKEIGIIKTTDKTKKVLDSVKYIEIKDVKKLGDDIGKFTRAILESGAKKSDDFIKSVKLTKAGFLAVNLAICAGFLGYVLPKIQYVYRKKVYGSDEFPGIAMYKEEAKKLKRV